MKISISKLIFSAVACISTVFVSPNLVFAGSGIYTYKACTEVNPDSPYYCEDEPITELDIYAPLLNDSTISVVEDAINNMIVVDLNDANTGNDTDLDGQVLSYSITAGNTDGVFAIDVNTGEIRISDNSKLDYAISSQYILTAQASDGNYTDSAAVTVGVTSINTDTTVIFDLSWTAPITRSDGTVLDISEIDGFRVYYGNTTDDMIPLVDINDGTATNYTITELSQDGYYFAMTAYDVEGLESGLSEIVYKEKF